MSNTLASGNTIVIPLQTGESLILNTITGTYSARITSGTGMGTVLATDSSAGATYGPYAYPIVIRLSCSVDGLTDFEVGTAPTLDYQIPVGATIDPVTGGISKVSANGVALGIATDLRQVSTRCYIPQNISGTARQAMSRTAHFARTGISNPKLVFPSWYVAAGTTETAQGAASQITASIEYPAGVFTQVTFSGAIVGSMPDNANFVSDAVSIDIPNGAQFWVRSWVSNAAALVYNSIYKSLTGEGYVVSTTTTPDLTMGGAVTQATTNVYGPCAIVAQSLRNRQKGP